MVRRSLIVVVVAIVGVAVACAAVRQANAQGREKIHPPNITMATINWRKQIQLPFALAACFGHTEKKSILNGAQTNTPSNENKSKISICVSIRGYTHKKKTRRHPSSFPIPCDGSQPQLACSVRGVQTSIVGRHVRKPFRYRQKHVDRNCVEIQSKRSPNSWPIRVIYGYHYNYC